MEPGLTESKENFVDMIEDEPVIELGDRIRIFGGKYDKTVGRVIYRTTDEIDLIPEGLTNMAIEFKVDEEGFDSEYGIESVEILQKSKHAALVEILDLNVDQDLETFGPDGNPLTKYRILKVNTEEDSITVVDSEIEEDGEEITLHFGFRGIPKDLPFRVIRGRQATEKPMLIPLEEQGETVEGKEGVEGVEDVEDVLNFFM